MSDTSGFETPPEPGHSIAGPSPRPGNRRRSGLMAAAAIVLVTIGIGAGSLGTALVHPRETAMLLKPKSVAALQDGSDVAISGKVTDIYGNKFIVADASGRTLVDAGWRGEGGDLVKPGEQLVVQGRFDRGFIHGDLLVRANGEAETLRPPHHGPRGWVERLEGPRVAAVGAPG